MAHNHNQPFNRAKPSVSNEIVGVRPNPKTINTIDFGDKGVKFNQELYTMENDTNYVVTFSELSPKIRKPASDIVSLENSAWFTRFGGYNVRRQLALGQHFGIPSIFVGVQQNNRRVGDLERTARDTLEIKKHIGERLGHHATALILNGISRGAMIADTTQSIAHEHGLHVVYKDSLVPCQPNGLNIVKSLRDVKDNIPSEIQATQSLNLPLSILHKYANTFDGTPRALKQQIIEFPALVNGKLGRLVRANPHKDEAFGYSLVYGGDILSRGEEFMDLYKDYPYTHVDLVHGGGHVSCASESNYQDWKERIDTVAELLHENPSIIELGASAMYLAATEVKPVFLKEYDLAS